MTKRVFHVVLCVIFAVVAVFFARNLLFVEAPEGARGESFVTTSWILLLLFGSLSLVFAVRAARGPRAQP